VKPGYGGTAHHLLIQGQYTEQILLPLLRTAGQQACLTVPPELLIPCDSCFALYQKGRATADTIITISNASLSLFDVSMITLIDTMQEKSLA